VETNVPRSAAAWQEGDATRCHHTNEPFDTAFRSVVSRRDISPAAKLVHAKLVSMHRLGLAWTQSEIGELVGMSRHQVWRAIAELVAAELILVTRLGLGNPNSYVLLGISDEDLAGRASRSRPAGERSPANRATPRARTFQPQRATERRGYNAPSHADAFGHACPCGRPEGYGHNKGCALLVIRE